MNNSDNREFFKALKLVIKSKKSTYKDLAHQIGMSESGLKKMMANEDCSLSKISEMSARTESVPLHSHQTVPPLI